MIYVYYLCLNLCQDVCCHVWLAKTSRDVTYSRIVHLLLGETESSDANLSIYLYIYLSVYLYIYLSIYLSIY